MPFFSGTAAVICVALTYINPANVQSIAIFLAEPVHARTEEVIVGFRSRREPGRTRRPWNLFHDLIRTGKTIATPPRPDPNRTRPWNCFPWSYPSRLEAQQ